MIVTVIREFSHAGKAYKFGDTPNFLRSEVQDFHAQGLVSLTGLPASNPTPAGGEVSPPSASLPAQASEQTISNESESGGGLTKRQRKQIEKFVEQS